MPDVETSEFVEITHFINPHVFWLRKCNTDDRDFEGIEIELQRYAMRQYAILPLYDRRLQIERNDRVAVYFVAWKKWLRCDVDVINANSERCILWAIDYGFPLQSPLRLVVSIEDLKLTQKCANRITKVAISTVVPTKHTKNVSRVSILLVLAPSHVQTNAFRESFSPSYCVLFASRSNLDLDRIVSDGHLRPSMF